MVHDVVEGRNSFLEGIGLMWKSVCVPTNCNVAGELVNSSKHTLMWILWQDNLWLEIAKSTYVLSYISASEYFYVVHVPPETLKCRFKDRKEKLYRGSKCHIPEDTIFAYLSYFGGSWSKSWPRQLALVTNVCVMYMSPSRHPWSTKWVLPFD
jgi:hypothetical protein